ncbi:MAG: malonyl-CoA decarboxylase family protein [Novosphingobium sp.]|nr:malonyl-CoA decarboxylase family protein [Novosphingobium sp.]
MSSRLGRLLGRKGVAQRQTATEELLDLASGMLSLRGRASGPALASAFLDLYEGNEFLVRKGFLARFETDHPHDAAAIDSAIAAWQANRNIDSAHNLNAATVAPSERLVRMLNFAPQGTQRLLAIREDLIDLGDRTPGAGTFAKALDDAFAEWFNVGFLDLRPISWDSPARLLERIIKYEAVHQIDGWEDLGRRVEPRDRRCYGFFHPQMLDDPLIFVEVALTSEVPGSIHQIIAEHRDEIGPREASCAIFYSISNCQKGLRGIPFGNYLIKRVVGLLQEELPHLKTFATLSPLPGFSKWLSQERQITPVPYDPEILKSLAAQYLVDAKHKSGLPSDSVARFHLGNGARLEAIHTRADLSTNGQAQSHGVMVNYVYDLTEIEANHFALNELGTVATSKIVQALAEAGRSYSASGADTVDA